MSFALTILHDLRAYSMLVLDLHKYVTLVFTAVGCRVPFSSTNRHGNFDKSIDFAVIYAQISPMHQSLTGTNATRLSYDKLQNLIS